ncbi:hypothetical protein BDC45DRAFT_515699 [Circinella umbellata]|nr:hypothetical protein BDC45DRAFT_515699 [Circinella umbellata]
MTYSTTTQHQQLEPCLARLGTMPEDKPSFVKQVNSVEDITTLRRLLIEKERERTSIANDLDVAARLGLVISETNEAIKIKLAHLEQENDLLRQEFTRTYHASSNHNNLTRDSTSSPPPDDNYAYHHNNHNNSNNTSHHHNNHDHHNHNHDIMDPDDEKIYLTQELEQARQELTKFRKEMDGLSCQLNDMASEMVDSRARVGMYAKRLAEVEHKLSTTREMNVNLQALLERALTSQKQSSSNTSHLVRNIQTDLTRVVTENDQLRARIADLEAQQVESEERLADMVGQAKKYASLLEQAQDTIHGLSEPRLSDDDTLSNGEASVSSYWDGGKETEITKGSAFSVEFRQEMQKEIERNLNLKNEIRHRIVTHESISSDKKKTQEGLKYLLSERSSDGLMSVSTSSSTTSSSTTTTTTKQSHQFLQPPPPASFSLSQHQLHQYEDNHPNNQSQQQQQQQQQQSQQQESSTTAPAASSSSSSTTTNTTTPLPQTQLRPASFLTGFNGFGSDNSVGPTSFITRGTTFAASRGTGDMPSISTRFFQRLATRFDEQHKIEIKR